ncbi:putative methyltransferase-like protein 25 isoform X2 [Petromyzon marinus]
MPDSLLLAEKAEAAWRFVRASMFVLGESSARFYADATWSRAVWRAAGDEGETSPARVLGALLGDVASREEVTRQSRSFTDDHAAAGSNTTAAGATFMSGGRLTEVGVFVREVERHTLAGLGLCTSLKPSSIQDLAPALDLRNCIMSPKKCHEVQTMVGAVASLAQSCGLHQVVELGSGKSYLGSELAWRYSFRVAGLDSSPTVTRGAERREERLLDRRRGRGGGRAGRPGETPAVPRSARPGEAGGHATVIAHVTPGTDLQAVLGDSGVRVSEGVLLAGLHACGDLSSTAVRLFCSSPHAHALCLVSCCYHRLTEQGDAGENLSSLPGFPMSQKLSSMQCMLGRNARMTACLSRERATHGKGLPTDSLFYWAVLQVLIRDHYDSGSSDEHVGKVFSKSRSFVDYCRRVLEKMSLDHAKLTDSEIQSYHDRYIDRKVELEAFNQMKAALAPCVEALILTDRLCYLQEQGVAHAGIVRLFNPMVSPRCFALVASKTAEPDFLTSSPP